MTGEPLSVSIDMDEKKPIGDLFSPPLHPTYQPPTKMDIKLEDTLFSASSPPPQALASSSRSRSTSPEGTPSRGNGVKKEKSPPAGPILISDLPLAWDDAHETFTTLEKCVYERKDLGLSRESDEMMVCDCTYDKHDPTNQTCLSDAECINRALFIECLNGECRAKGQCRNQRFMKRQYAPVEIVLTEMKGFGLRAADDIPTGSLIYEYIGEVVQEKTFRKRMAQYADEGIRHFYFMMLQKEEYIDATKKGGIGRFANHSCNPNSEVQKWVVGRRLRMGIFTKRDVVKGEEITFNYNVDRYGHDAQICYCGEANCVGYIGGKTQTDSSIGTMNDLFIDALGIADEVKALQLKGNKKKKSRELDEDFIPTLRPIVDTEVQKVAAAIRQSGENVKMMAKLLERINMTEDPVVQRQLMRIHGFGLMNMVLTQLSQERQVVLLALESMAKWKLQIRNKIEDSGIEEPVKQIAESDDEQLKGIAKGLLEYWSTLEMSYKIPRKPKIQSLDEDDEAATTTIAEADQIPRIETPRRPQTWENDTSIELKIAPVKPRLPTFNRPRPPPPPSRPSITQSASASADRLKLDAIIAMAQQNVVAAAAATASASPAAESSRSGSRNVDADDDESNRRKRPRHDSMTEEERERRKEKELKLLVGGEVVRSMTKYKQFMEHETFKKYAQECTELLVDKEKRGHSYAAHRHPTLNDEKKAKMKEFTKSYAHKILKKLKEKGKLKKGSSASTSSHSRNGVSEAKSTPSATPATTSDADASTILATPNNDHDDLVNDIFGGNDDEVDRDYSQNGLSKRLSMDVDDGSILDSSSLPFAPPTPPSNSHFTPSKRDRSDSMSNGNYGAIKVDSFRPGQPAGASLLKTTPSRTPTSGGDPSPEFQGGS